MRARMGSRPGSVYLADQKLAVAVPRVRDRRREVEVPLASYTALQEPRALDEGLFRRVLGGIACGEYGACAEAVPAAFGLSRATVSRRFVRASARHLATLQERPLDQEEWVALFLDGKRFAEDELVIAVGVTGSGQKQVLGFVQTATENRKSCAAFLRSLVERGFTPKDGLLVVLDGAKGLRAAVEDVWSARAQVQRCQWHKRENVLRPRDPVGDKPLAPLSHGRGRHAQPPRHRLIVAARGTGQHQARQLGHGRRAPPGDNPCKPASAVSAQTGAGVPSIQSLLQRRAR